MSQPNTINVIVAMDFADSLIESLREVSPRLHVTRAFPRVTDEQWSTTDVLYTVSIFPTPEQAPRLRWIQLHSAGVEQAMQQPIVTSSEVELTNTSGMHAVQIAEYCLGMMLAFNYQIPAMLDLQHNASWPEKPHERFAPLALRGRTLGIVGYGAIGRELARIADAMGMTILAIKRDVMHPADDDSYREPGTGDPAGEIPDRIYPPEAIQSMAKACDFLVLATPLTDATQGLITADVLKAMKKTAVLINIARGGVVDESALIEALRKGLIGGAALDVFNQEPLPPDNPLWAMPNVIISPHVAGYVANYHEKAAALFAENLGRYVDNRPLLNRVAKDHGY